MKTFNKSPETGLALHNLVVLLEYFPCSMARHGPALYSSAGLLARGSGSSKPAGAQSSRADDSERFSSRRGAASIEGSQPHSAPALHSEPQMLYSSSLHATLTRATPARQSA